MDGWAKIKGASKYAGISERTMRTWLKEGLKFSRLPTGTILIKYTSIDQYLEQFTTQDNKVDLIVNETLRAFK